MCSQTPVPGPDPCGVCGKPAWVVGIREDGKETPLCKEHYELMRKEFSRFRMA